LRRVGKETTKRGWFDNVWNGELSLRVLDGLDEEREQCSKVTARIVTATEIEGTPLKSVVESWRKLRHPNVARVLGFFHVLPPVKVAVILNCGPTTDLLMSYLRCERNTGSRLDIATGIASGLEYLHLNGITHGELRSANIVIDGGVLKLVDYGLFSYSHENRDTFVHRLFKAPEVLEHSNNERKALTPKSDIYALGMTFYEVFTERLPFDGIATLKSEFAAEVLKGTRPRQPGSVAERRGLSPQLWSLMCECWLSDARSRPSSVEVVRRIREISVHE